MREVIANYITPDFCNGKTTEEVAQAILDLIRSEGFVIVPKEPTEAMLTAVIDPLDYEVKAGATNVAIGRIVYRAMIEASQESE